MKVEDSTTRTITVTEVPGWDPIRIMLTDNGDGRGGVTITGDCEAMAGYWGAMGCSTVEFLCSTDVGYLINKMRPALDHTVYSPEGMQLLCKKRVLEMRRNGELDEQHARDMFDAVENLIDFEELPEGESSMYTLLGGCWPYESEYPIPLEPNPKYQRLEAMMTIVQQALREVRQ